MFLEFVAKYSRLKLLKMQLKISQCLMLISAKKHEPCMRNFFRASCYAAALLKNLMVYFYVKLKSVSVIQRPGMTRRLII